MGARDDVAGPLDAFLLELANDRGCTTDDLSVKLYRAAEAFALECYRRGGQAVHDARTVPEGAFRERLQRSPFLSDTLRLDETLRRKR